MKKVLITGAGGTIGRKVLKYVLSEGKYDVTVLDLKTKRNAKNLRKYRRRVNVVYGDINDSDLLEDLIKDMNYVIHLAGVLPPLADLNSNLTNAVDYKGTENIVRIIDFYNPDCHLLYASSSSVYGKQDTDYVTVKTKCNLTEKDIYSNTKLEAEELIKRKLNNYTIFRLPIILCDILKDNFLFCYPNNINMELISDDDVAYMFSRSLDKKDIINKKTFNVGGGESCYINSRTLNKKLIEAYGLTQKQVNNKLFIDKNFYTYRFKDSDKLEEILSYRNDSIASFFMRIKRRYKYRKISKLFGKLFLLKKENNKED